MPSALTPQAQYWLLAASALTLAPLVAELPWWVSGSALLLLSWHFARIRFGWPLAPRVLAIGLALIGTLLIVRSFGTFMGRDAGTALLVLLLGLKFLELRTHRDAMLVALLLCVLLAANLLFAEALWLGAFMLLASATIAASLYALTQPRQRVSAQIKFAAVLVAAALPLALALHFLFPRIEGALWRMPMHGNSGVTGMSETMRPGSVAAVSESDAVVLRARFPGARAPVASQRYWRTVVLWRSDGATWTRGGPQQARANFTPLSAPLDYVVSLEPSGERWLPTLDVPAHVPAGARVLPGLILEQLRPAQTRMNYSLRSYTQYRSGALGADERAHALQQPPVGARTRALAQSWRAHGDAAAIVARALTFFNSQDFYYSLQPPRLGADPVEGFLFDTRVGYCEHFAGAFVTLMRTAGVPARVVLGYQGGEYNATGDYLIVREYDAHAWAEVWLADRGWMRVDPTAAVAPERIRYGSAAIRRLVARGGIPGRTDERRLAGLLELDTFERALRSARWLWDASNNGWNHWVADYSAAQQQRLLSAFGLDGWPRLALTLLLASLVLGGLGFYAWLFVPARARDPVRALYVRFTRKLARIGLARAAHEGPRDYAARCARVRPDLRLPIDAITGLYIDARYGAGGNLCALRRRVRAFRPRRLLTDTKAREDAAQ